MSTDKNETEVYFKWLVWQWCQKNYEFAIAFFLLIEFQKELLEYSWLVLGHGRIAHGGRQM